MRRRAFATAALSGLLSGCQTPSAVQVDQSTIDDIARCGAGVRVQTSATLNVAVANDIHGRRVSLSAGHEKLIRAAIIQANGKITAQTDYLYERYVTCIEGRNSLNAEIVRMKAMRDQTISIFKNARVPPDEIIDWTKLANETIDDASRMDFIAEQRNRGLAAVKFIQIAEAATKSPFGFGADITLGLQNYEKKIPLDVCKLFSTSTMCADAKAGVVMRPGNERRSRQPNS